MGNAECSTCLGKDKEAGDDAHHPKWTQKKAVSSTTLGQYVVDKTTAISDDYLIDKKKDALGQGTFGAVFKAKDKTTGALRAIKSIELRTKFQIATFESEMSLMTKVTHPNIIKLFESYRDGFVVYLVMELCAGGELFDRIIDEQSNWTEKHSAIMMKQILGATYYLHRENIIHRDIKPENFLFLNRDPIENCVLKIIDFGLSRELMPDCVCTTKAGTAYYIAPEVLQGRYNHSADVWSCGVLMFIFLCGYPPFHGSDDNVVFAKIRAGKFDFAEEYWSHVSKDAKDLITQMLVFKYKDRITAEKSLQNCWVRDMAPKSNDNHLASDSVDHLRNFRSSNKLKKAALHIIARQVNEEKIESLRKTFMELDDNGDGELSLAELQEGIKTAGVANPADFEEILKGVDADGNGNIDYAEFLASMLEKQEYTKEDMVRAAFRVFDVDGDGKITLEELKQVLNSQELQEAKSIGAIAMPDDYETLMKEVDKDGNGHIDFAEFMAMMCKTDGHGHIVVEDR